MLEQDDSYSFNSLFSSNLRAMTVVEDQIVKCCGKLLPDTEFLRVLSSKEYCDNIIICLSLFKGLGVFKRSG